MYTIYHSFMNVHLIIILLMFFGNVYLREGVDFFTVKEPTLHAVCYLHWKTLLEYMYIYFNDLFDLSNKQGGRFLGRS